MLLGTPQQCASSASNPSRRHTRDVHSSRGFGVDVRRPAAAMATASCVRQQAGRRFLPPVAVSFAEPPAAAASEPPAPGPSQPPAPAVAPLASHVPWQQAGQGLTFFADGRCSFRVWAPHASAVTLQVVPGASFVASPPGGAAGARTADLTGVDVTPAEYQPRQEQATQPDMAEHRLIRADDDWGIDLPVGALRHGDAYRLVVTGPGGQQLLRRDPWARSAEASSSWGHAHSPAAYTWRNTDWQPHSFDKLIIYEMHVGSFTPEGTLQAAIDKLPHIAACGFTMLELMPCSEHSDPWGYNPRLLTALHRGIGTPEDMAAFVDAAHANGLGVMMDIVLHHGAPSGNMLWDWDGWEEGHNGGIYHEGAPDCTWGRTWAFWKSEVRRMVVGACEAWLRDYRMDGLRFDSIKDVPMDMVQEVTWHLKQHYPGRFLSAEITPEDPALMKRYGFDAIWVHSGYFDIIQQHRALGRGHHGGGDWADGWDLPRLRTAMGVHYGFESPTQCIKYMTGSHDQVGCQNNGGWYQDYAPVGGHHRFAVDQFCGGRTDPNACASSRLWYAANVGAAGLPMLFMGTEVAQSGWWHSDQWHRMNWDNAADEIGRGMMAAVAGANKLRHEYPALRYGWANCLHEDRQNGVMGYERVAPGEARVIVVVNAARKSWQAGEYGLWVGGGGSFKQVYCSQDAAYGGDPSWLSNGEVAEFDGRIHINLPAACTLMLVQQG